MSPKAIIVILWACVVAGAAVASEKLRTRLDYEEHTIELHEMHKSHLRVKQHCDSLDRLT